MLRRIRPLYLWLTEQQKETFIKSFLAEKKAGTLKPQLNLLAEYCESINRHQTKLTNVLNERSSSLSCSEVSTMSEKDKNEWMSLFDSDESEHLKMISKEWDELRGVIISEIVKAGYFEDDSIDCRIEVKQGAGGAEAQAWAGELFSAYEKFAIINNLQFESLASDKSDLFAACIKRKSKGSPGAYGLFRFEHGIHRMQRFPTVILTKDKPQTIAASVAVLPIRDTDKIELKSSDLVVIQQRSCAGPGGQGLQAANQAIRMKHTPTGIEVFCTESRSHLDNRKTALEKIKQKIADLEAQKREEKLLSNKRSAFGSGAWAEKIRSYNAYRYEIIDMRLNTKMVFDLQSVLEGDFSVIVDALQEQRENMIINEWIQKEYLPGP